MKLFLITAAAIAAIVVFARFLKARAASEATSPPESANGDAPPAPETAVDEHRLRADLEAAKRDGDRARIAALEDRLRAHEYWKKRNTAVAAEDRQRVANESKTISDWNTNEKRFNNLR